MGICPFDHLPRTIIRKNSTNFNLKVFFPNTEYLEKSYDELEIKKKDLIDLLTKNNECINVKSVKIGVVTQSEYEKVIIY